MTRLIGFGLFLFGFWFLGQNIIFYSSFNWFSFTGLLSGASILLLLAGVCTLVFGNRATRNQGIVMLIFSIILIFLSGRVYITPTSLAEVFLGVAAMIIGGNLTLKGESEF